ncbi:unnamed protein product [Trypanosoma congolense IL3000]|uniref:WGS project CAEQ00000000 data, annotated contig 660 n=1 Tax=Trypanosoma congolense (strain IL3000) TaxID=1068625 RepID=F9WHK1_TRYCI|nr:unnamed protein product [Trypanosoma congolense IL3000]
MLEDEGAAECLSDSRDSLYKRLQMKHAELRVNHLVNLRKTLEIENAAASKKFHKMPMSLDLISDEINLALSEITVRCEEHGVPQISHLVKEVRTMMNRQLREAYGHIEAGYKSAFHKLRETSEVQDRRHERTTVAEELNSKPREVAEPNDSVPPVGGEQCLNDKKADKNTDKRNPSGQKILSLTEAVSATTTFFAESIAVLLRCEIVRVYLYDDYGNLNLCARFPCDVTKGDPISGTI